jgi:threonylcarbamoyladenosine tRNA methylthiotransferase MtaB
VSSFSVHFLGCKMSFSDADAMRERLLAAGHEERSEAADVALVNTCCVTGEAVAKSRKTVARAARTHDRVYVTGCAANLEGAFAGVPANVVVVKRPSDEAREVVAAALGSNGGSPRELTSRRVRAFVPIQDGCSFACSYCIVPFVRGPRRSRPAADVLIEIGRRVEQGHKEIVLSGINLGSYRDRGAGYSLPRLVREAAETAGLVRLRLSSIEVNHVSEELVSALQSTSVVCKHLHVPLQSGDDYVLRAMNRRYDATTFLRRLEPLADFNLTTDVIVGFPGEDEAAFLRTLEVVERAGITKVHVFPYSPRPGTATAERDTVSSNTKRERSARMRVSSQNACLRRWRGKIGVEETVLIDRPGRGYGDDYTPWLVEGRPGELVRARASTISSEGIVGRGL